jgi:hypothetical protein
MIAPVRYSARSQSIKDAYDALPHEKKNAKFWDSEVPDVVAIRAEIKKHYLAQQNYRCAYCQQQILVSHHAAWDTEHIIPKFTHPQFMFTEENLCVSCKDCNNEKRDKNVLKSPNRVRFPAKKEDYSIAHPHYDVFSEHIRHLPHSLFFLPKTKKGVKTIEVCGLLRFVLSFGDYEISDTQIKKEIAIRNDLLQETQDPAEYMFLIAELQDLMEKLKVLAREAGMKKIMDRREHDVFTTKRI